jgi:hypothetical protein
MGIVHQLVRSSLVVAGLLLAGVGVADTIAGRSKIAQYQEVLHATAVPAPSDPAALFPTASEGQERHELARAKLGFYQLFCVAGRILSAVGITLIALGVLRLRIRTLRASAESAP